MRHRPQFHLFARLAKCLFAGAVCMLAPSIAQSAGTPAKNWAAQWITAPDAPQRDFVVLHFRKVIETDASSGQFLLDVSADNQFIFYVNGRETGRGPSRGDLHHWRYETYDIAPLLHPGKNTLSAIVWQFGTRAAIAQISERAGFLVHGRGEAERSCDTDASWEVQVEHAVQLLRPQVHGYYAAEPGERFDGTKTDWAWQDVAASRDSSHWLNAVTLGRGSRKGETDAPNNWQLIADPLPPMEMTEERSGNVVRATGVSSVALFPNASFRVEPHSKASVLIDHGQLTTGFPVFSVREGSGATIRVTYAEALVDAKGEKGNRNQLDGKHIEGLQDEFLPNGGPTREEFSPLSWRAWRFLQIDVETGEQPLQIDGVRTVFSAYPFNEKGYFRSNDASLDAIWKIGWRTARLDAHDTYMDTPYWERLQYIGDTRIQALISYTVAGDDRLARQAIEAFNNSRVAEGPTQSRYPSSLVQMIPTFSLLWVGMVHDFWMYRQDQAFVKAQIPGTRTVLEWFLLRQRNDGLLGRLPWWPFVDWGEDFASGMPPQDEDGGSAAMTLQFVEALRYAADLEERFGDKSLAANYRDRAEHASNAVWKLCWNEKYGLIADTPAQAHFSQHANILAVWLDAIPEAHQKKVLKTILADSYAATPAIPKMTAATYYFRFYLARALQHVGMGEEYLKQLGPWHEMISLGLTTWAESPEPTRSDSHAWSSHPNYDFLTIVAGIRPASDGFKRVEIEPQMGILQTVHAGMPVQQGLIKVDYEKTGAGLDAKVEMPGNIEGDIVWKGKRIPLHQGQQEIHLP
jgi:alpha-L-rhamnosidase